MARVMNFAQLVISYNLMLVFSRKRVLTLYLGHADERDDRNKAAEEGNLPPVKEIANEKNDELTHEAAGRAHGREGAS